MPEKSSDRCVNYEKPSLGSKMQLTILNDRMALSRWRCKRGLGGVEWRTLIGTWQCSRWTTSACGRPKEADHWDIWTVNELNNFGCSKREMNRGKMGIDTRVLELTTWLTSAEKVCRLIYTLTTIRNGINLSRKLFWEEIERIWLKEGIRSIDGRPCLCMLVGPMHDTTLFEPTYWMQKVGKCRENEQLSSLFKANVIWASTWIVT